MGPGGGSSGLVCGEALSASFSALLRNLGTFMGLSGVFMLAMVAAALVAGVTIGVTGGLDQLGQMTDTSGGVGRSYNITATDFFDASPLGTILGFLLFAVIQTVFLGAMLNAAMAVFEGRPIGFAQSFQNIPWLPLGSVVVLDLVVGDALGSSTCCLTGVVIGVLTIFVAPAAIHRDAEGFKAFDVGFRTLNGHWGDVILLAIALAVLPIVCLLACVLPVFFVPLPIQALATVYMYRRFTGRVNVTV